jgi:hypothetical protein
MTLSNLSMPTKMQKNANDFTPEQIIFATALADPTDNRTQAEIAASLNVHPTTLCRWKKEAGFGELVWKLTYQNLEAEIGRVSAVVLRNALSGDSRSLKLFYEILGKIGAQRTAAVCTKNHFVDEEEMAESLRRNLTERELQIWIQETKRQLGITNVDPDNFRIDSGLDRSSFEKVSVEEFANLETV